MCPYYCHVVYYARWAWVSRIGMHSKGMFTDICKCALNFRQECLRRLALSITIGRTKNGREGLGEGGRRGTDGGGWGCLVMESAAILARPSLVVLQEDGDAELGVVQVVLQGCCRKGWADENGNAACTDATPLMARPSSREKMHFCPQHLNALAIS